MKYLFSILFVLGWVITAEHGTAWIVAYYFIFAVAITVWVMRSRV